jgi:hypothetical protein
MVPAGNVTTTVLRCPMTTTPADRSEPPAGFRRHSYGSQCDGKRPYKQDVKRAIKSAERTRSGSAG